MDRNLCERAAMGARKESRKTYLTADKNKEYSEL